MSFPYSINFEANLASKLPSSSLRAHKKSSKEPLCKLSEGSLPPEIDQKHCFSLGCLMFLTSQLWATLRPKIKPSKPKLCLKMASWSPRRGPRGPKMGPKTAQDGSEAAQDGPRTHQGGSKTLQERLPDIDPGSGEGSRRASWPPKARPGGGLRGGALTRPGPRARGILFRPRPSFFGRSPNLVNAR